MTESRPFKTTISVHQAIADALYQDKRRDETWNEFFQRTYGIEVNLDEFERNHPTDQPAD